MKRIINMRTGMGAAALALVTLWAAGSAHAERRPPFGNDAQLLEANVRDQVTRRIAPVLEEIATELQRRAREYIDKRDAELATRTLRARRLNWISIPALTAPMRVKIKIRHRHEPAWATLEPAVPGEVLATFDEPQRAITPGQSAVFYQEDEVVGGGWII